MRHLLILALLCLPAAAHAQSPVGDWRTFDDHTGRERGMVRLTLTPDGIAGRIVATIDPKEASHVCEKCSGDRQGQPIIGLEFLRGMKPDGDEWDGGTILDPETGSVYRCEMHLADGGKTLVLRGYIGFAFIGRTQRWKRAE